MGSDMSMPGDVYSFGILLLKMFASRRPTDSIFSDGQTLHEFVKMTLLNLEVGAGINNVENSALDKVKEWAELRSAENWSCLLFATSS